MLAESLERAKRDMKVWLALLALLAVPGQALANSPVTTDWLSATTYYSTYMNSGLSSGSSSGGASSSGASQVAPMPSNDIEIALRLQTIFSLTFLWSRFQDPDPNNTAVMQDRLGGMGLGMKVDMPGFFFIGGSKNQSTRERKLYPVNTFLYGEILKMNVTDVSDDAKITTTAPRYGFGADFFPATSNMYFSLRLQFFNLIGATYLSYAWGFGLRI